MVKPGNRDFACPMAMAGQVSNPWAKEKLKFQCYFWGWQFWT